MLELPATTWASTVHEGASGRLGEAYRALEHWMTEHGYRPGGPPIEFYLGERAAATYRIEVAIPIAR